MDSPYWKFISKEDGVLHTNTYAMEIPNTGCLVRVSSMYTPISSNTVITEAITFVPWTKIEEVLDAEGVVTSRKLVSTNKF